MKTIFSNSDLVHTFAQKTQDEGRTSNNSLFFKGNKIYSYGYHYLLGEFLDDNTILINSKGYSNTTAKHTSMLMNAVSHYRRIMLPIHRSEQIDVKYISILIQDASIKILKARNKENYSSYIISTFEKLEDFLNEFNKPLLKDEDFKQAKKIYKAIKKDESKYIEDAKERVKKAELKEQEKFKKDLKKFFNYELDYIYKKTIKEDFLRISLDKERIETTQGIKVSIQDAKNLYLMIKQGKDIKGVRIDNYTIISLNGHLKIGCHNINVKNMHEIGRLINN